MAVTVKALPGIAKPGVMRRRSGHEALFFGVQRLAAAFDGVMGRGIGHGALWFNGSGVARAGRDNTTERPARAFPAAYRSRRVRLESGAKRCDNSPMDKPQTDKPQTDSPRQRLQALLSIPERQRTDAQWDEIVELEITLAPGNRAGAPDQHMRRTHIPGTQGNLGGGGGGQNQGRQRQGGKKFHKRPPKRGDRGGGDRNGGGERNDR